MIQRILLVLASSKRARWVVGAFSEIVTNFSLSSNIDPAVEVPLRPIGVNARITIHPFRRDLTNLIVILVNNVYEKHCSLSEGDFVVDCGAYIGEFTIQAASKVGRDGLVLAFEPNPTSFDTCMANVARNNLRNVRLFPLGLSDQETHRYLAPNKINGGAAKFVDSPRKGTVAVEVKTLSQFAAILGKKAIKLLKMDVEGDATRIVLGSKDLFRNRQIQNVSVELHQGEEELQTILSNLGFECFREDNYLYAKLRQL